ncbi:MAG: cell division protein SepF [Nitrososphaeraceae archaeon]|jgi:SepF-like predicted cell division protein (DUF552 family)|nr:cell division protein SepF [Nitrososphaeraceae archaeon]
MQAHEPQVYLKAITLRDPVEVQLIKEDLKRQMIVIIRVTPLAQKSVDELRRVIDDLYKFVQSAGGDIARLGEERVVITPSKVKIWRGAYELT